MPPASPAATAHPAFVPSLPLALRSAANPLPPRRRRRAVAVPPRPHLRAPSLPPHALRPPRSPASAPAPDPNPTPAPVPVPPAGRVLLHALVPALLTGALPALSEAEAFVSDAEADSSQVARILGATVLGLLVYATVGAIILSINSAWVAQNDRREKRLIEELLRENPRRKTLSDGTLTLAEIRDIARGKKRSPKMPPPPAAGNRESRRIERKRQEREARDKKKAAKRAQASSADEPKPP